METMKLGKLYVLIAITAVLFVAMLVLCGMYLDLRLNGITSSLKGIPENDKWILTDGGYNSQKSSLQLVSPTFIGVKSSVSGMSAAVYDEGARKSLEKRIEPYMTSLFNGGVEKIEYTDAMSKSEYVANVMSADDYVYMCFYNQLPAETIMPGMFGKANNATLNESFFVKYMFILPYENSVRGICFDEALNAYRLTAGIDVTYDKSVFYAYNELSGFASFDFITEDYPEPVFTRSFEVNSVFMAPSFSFYKFNLQDNMTLELLKVLEFNTNLVKTYSYGNNNIVNFIDEECDLSVSVKNGRMVFNGNIHMSEFLNYYPQNERYVLADTVLCVKNLVSSFNKVLVGGDAVPCIIGVSYNGREAEFRLKYFYNGIIVTENDEDIVVKISDDHITKIEINALFCDSGSLTVPVIPQSLAAATLGDVSADDGFVGYNAMFGKNGSTGATEFMWIIRREGA